ncbi:NACHT domain-containing protein [Nitrincola sp. MINF-07-Sa-05]|uniref:NACHT domain-containing protein n=1 Tax=Nitrincola salilacus TaxID=3400273 RepID=UPI0039182BA2
MSYGAVPLERRFSLVRESNADSDEQDFRSFFSELKRTGWPELEKEFRCVILAEAGAGKTFEMEARAKHIETLGLAAFFIRIEDIEDGFEAAFEVGSVNVFENWLSSQEEAWFFLDSVDEARLENSRAFEKAIKRFSARIKSADQRARIFISSRPYAWRARSDRELVERYLPFIKPKSEETGDRDVVFEDVNADEPVELESALRVYLLDPLDESGIRSFAGHRGAPQVDKLILELLRANLMSMAARPFDLEGILAKWSADQTLDGRLELLQHNIDLRLKEIDPDRARRQPLNREKARRGARVLAAAVILTGEPGIRVPDSTNPDKGIDAEAILSDWEPIEVQTLLERGIFNDVLYGIVRFRHREIRELLAAEWISDQLKNGSFRYATEALFFREQYGHSVITPRLRPILPWLILFDDEIRHKALGIAPEVAVEGGDAAQLPFVERQALLNDIVRRIAENQDDHSARDNGAIARIAQPDLSSDVLRLIADHRGNDDAIFFLGRLVWQGEMTECVPALSWIATDPARGIYARIAATRAVMTGGTRDQRCHLWEQLIASTEVLPRQVFAEVLKNAEADMVSVDFLLASVAKLEAYERYKATGLGQALHGFIGRLPIYSSVGVLGPLAALVRGLNDYLEREPYIERQECHVSKEFSWLLGPATHAVERLVSARSETALSSEALSVMLKVPVARFWRGDDFDEYKSRLYEIVPAWSKLNDALFWRSVDEARNRLEEKKSERLIDDWSVQLIGHYWKFGANRFHDVLGFIATCDFLDDKLVALSLAHRLFMLADKPGDWSSQLKLAVEANSYMEERLNTLLKPMKPQSTLKWEEREAQREEKQRKKQETRDRSRAEWIEYLKAAPEIVRYPSGLRPDEFSQDQYRLLVEIEGADLLTSRVGGANWKALIPEFGEDVARAYRDAAMSHWRNFIPGLLSEGHDTSSIPYSLFFAMAGLEIEAAEVDHFPSNLTEAEVTHALRFFVRELNGFPFWLEKLHHAHPNLTMDAILTELHWELAYTEADRPMHYILHDLVYYSSWLHQYLAPSITVWLEQNEILNQDTLRYCIHILLSGCGDSETVAKLARLKIESNVVSEQLAVWYALWVDLEAEEAIPAVEHWLSSLSEKEVSKEAQLFITRLMGSQLSSSTALGRGSFRNVKHLKALYILMHRYIRAQDDIERAGKGLYSPELRDDAQDGRDALFRQLSEIPGKETFIALAELAKDHPDASYRPWMQKLAYKRAEEDADLEPWSAQQVRDYDQHQARTPTTHRQLFDLTVDRLIDLKAWIELGNDSPYKTWQRAESETEMRNLVAGWLNARSSGRYTCVQENELPNRQRPDIWTQNARVPSPVPIELKLLDKGWSGPKLCERLRNQLVGDYLREETAGCGVMLLIWQGQSTQSHWQIGDLRVGLAGLEDALRSYWDSVANNFPGVVAIEVIMIDLTVRDTKSDS